MAQGESWVDFSAEEWVRLEASIDKGLQHLLTQYDERYGIFGRRTSSAQPALTSLAVMAFLSRGHQPGQGPYGKQLDRAIEFVLSTQDKYGFFCSDKEYSHHGGTYSHAISGVMLAEVLGMSLQQKNERIDTAIKRGLEATIKLQQRRKNSRTDKGGWRYIKLRPDGSDADLSVSTWHLLFLRAAKNANYNVPQSLVQDATSFVKKCYNPQQEQFGYLPGRNGTITMTGAGTLCMFLAGQFDDPTVAGALRTIDRYNFRLNDIHENRWPYYTCYHSSQVASQAGGELRNSTLREIAEFLIKIQESDGSWPAHNTYGTGYSSSLAVLSLTPAYQILPIYQQ